ncbi:MAG TPA: AMP-binding protein, partial [Acidimicrobiales bacterium]|nr:AMP-binding protein [Acidimicrobiales bacterium]
MTELGFWAVAAADPDRMAIVDAEERVSTFGGLLAASNQVAHGLRAHGLQRGDAIAVVLPNQIAFVELYLAAAQIGLYFTPVNFHLTGPEIAYILQDAEVKAFFAGERYAAACGEAAEEASIPTRSCFAVGKVDGFRSYDELKDGQPDTNPADRSAGQTMLYTSGTTGRPKGVRRPLPDADPDTAAGLSALLASLFEVQPGEGVHLAAGPLYHAAPLAFGTGALHLGHGVVLMDRWTPERTLELIERYQVTSSHMVPTMFHRLLALPDDVKSSYDLSCLQNVIHAAAPCPVDVKRRMIEWWGPVIYEYYAATEGGGTYVKPLDWLEHPGTVGQPFPGSTIKILDDDDHESPAGTSGTVYMGSIIGNFEYYKDPDKTADSRRGDLFTVGDVGYLDEDGWLFLNDRKADMIISGGVNIYPAEIEAALLSHPAVGDAAVLGVPNDEWGEEVKAVVQLAEGVEATPSLAEALVVHCRDQLAGYKVPR